LGVKKRYNKWRLVQDFQYTLWFLIPTPCWLRYPKTFWQVEAIRCLGKRLNFVRLRLPTWDNSTMWVKGGLGVYEW
jgi:hypothetical protein